MISNQPQRFLRSVLFLDALTCVGCGTLVLAAARPLVELTQIPLGILTPAGIALLPIAAFMALVAAAGTRSSAAVGAVVAGNLAWCAASLWLMTRVAMTGWGYGFVAAQALVVLGLSILELRAGIRSGVLRRGSSAVACVRWRACGGVSAGGPRAERSVDSASSDASPPPGNTAW
jgi:hypothetical protein